jgi:hypothetical protein
MNGCWDLELKLQTCEKRTHTHTHFYLTRALTIQTIPATSLVRCGRYECHDYFATRQIRTVAPMTSYSSMLLHASETKQQDCQQQSGRECNCLHESRPHTLGMPPVDAFHTIVVLYPRATTCIPSCAWNGKRPLAKRQVSTVLQFVLFQVSFNKDKQHSWERRN